MDISKAHKVLDNNEKAIGNSFLYFLHECSRFDQEAYQEYYKCLKILGKHKCSSKTINTLAHIHPYILSCFIYHFDANDSYEIKEIPQEYGNYLEDINIAFQNVFKSKLDNEI